MAYTGQVSVGGDADVRTVPGLRITKVATPPFENNCYLLRCTETADALLVDAAGD
ncbi:MAG: beta-lactamase domain protein, partial [Frankiales bacterium]|nr:beta-lactamase domain protein [Frankiales bacterium]